jgi:acetolactate synthase I/III small subunit
VKVRATDRSRPEIIKVVELYGSRIVDLTAGSVIVEATGTEVEVDAIVALLRGFGIKELVRTGTVVMSRGSGSIEESSGRRHPRARSRGTSEGDSQERVEGARPTREANE